MKKTIFFIALFLLTFSLAWAQNLVKITKRTTEAELKAICANFEKQGAKLEITKCERKKNGNIYCLAGKVTNQTGSNGTFKIENMGAVVIKLEGNKIDITAKGAFIKHTD